MSSERRLEYEKGPRLEDDGESDDEGSGTDAGESGGGDGDDSERAARPEVTVPSWTAGLIAGTSAFVVVSAMIYQVVAAVLAAGSFGGAETQPSRTVMAGLATLANHGAVLEVNGEPIEGTVGGLYPVGLVTNFTPLVPIIVLSGTGYLLVRYVRIETRRDAGLAVGACVSSYTALMIGLATVTEWTPEAESSGAGSGASAEPETIAVATDVATVVTVSRTALVFVLLGAVVAALPRLLESGPLARFADAD